mmetsp:Transcript_3060/g.7416  ORF Transcript_3060/g.7416 Transcript_3060/m.7416 type:complete len:286 (+) Transcript_3060:878-1735(+)
MDDAVLPLIPEHPPVDALAPSAVAVREVAALAHEAGDDAVEDRAFEVKGLARLAETPLAGGERSEIVGRSWGDLREELELDSPSVLSADADVEEHVGIRLVVCVLWEHRGAALDGVGATEVEVRYHHEAEEDDGADEDVGQHWTLGLLDVDFQDFHLEDKHCSPWNGASSTLAVAQRAGNSDLPAVALSHELECFRPAWHHLIRPEGHRLPSVVRRVEAGAICQKTPVVNLHRCRLFWALSVLRTAPSHLVLQAGRQLNDALALRVLLEVFDVLRPRAAEAEGGL